MDLGISGLECSSSHRHDDQALSVLLEVAPSQALDCAEQLIQQKCDHVAGPDSDPVGAMGGMLEMHCSIREQFRLFFQISFAAQPSKQMGWNLHFNPSNSTIRQSTPQKCKH